LGNHVAEEQIQAREFEANGIVHRQVRLQRHLHRWDFGETEIVTVLDRLVVVPSRGDQRF